MGFPGNRDRRRDTRIQKLSVSLFCFYFVYGAINCSFVNGERTRHHHARQLDDPYVSQLENSSVEDSSNAPLGSCPNCFYKSETEIKSETDNLRLEAIKRQILSKLGLHHKPNVTYMLPREVLLETLFRAEDSVPSSAKMKAEDADVTLTSTRTSTMDVVDVDDFYGRTSEIISFAEQGYRVNGNRLLEFRVSIEQNQMGQEFRVKAATLWLKAEFRHPRSSKCKTTEIFVFKFSSRMEKSMKLNEYEFNLLTKDPITLKLDELNSGWQKLDLTETVRSWLGLNSKDRLSLLVDCSCCSNWHIHLFNSEVERKNDPNRPFLVIHTDPNTAKRVRRRALDCTVDSGNQCCKQRFYVNFTQMGWDDWVIAPKGYHANYCRGDCGHHRTPDMYVSYHSHVIDEIRKTHHLSGMQPCCAPLKFSSMSLIYFGPDSNIIKRDLPKMVVDECGCP